LAFDVSSLAGTPYSSVELVLTKQNTDGSAPTSVVHNAFGITDNGDWDTGSLLESAITWNNAPNNATGSATGFVDQGSTSSDASRFLDGETVFKADASGTEYRFDVTDYVNWAIGENNSYSSFATSDSDEIITFMIAWDSVIGGDTYTFHSKETNSLLAPRLEAEMVPLPAGLWLGLTGILGVVVLRRRAW
jgi:hypothetical protein